MIAIWSFSVIIKIICINFTSETMSASEWSRNYVIFRSVPNEREQRERDRGEQESALVMQKAKSHLKTFEHLNHKGK